MDLVTKPSLSHSRPGRLFLLTLLFITLAACHSTASASPKTTANARRVVRGWLARGNSPFGMRMSKDIATVDTYSDVDALSLYHVVHLEPSGFVITSTDDEIDPIVAFSDNGTYEYSEANPLCALVTNDMRVRMRSIHHRRTVSSVLASREAAESRSEAQQKWGDLEHSPQVSSPALAVEAWTNPLSDMRVAPLIETQWSQTTASGYACYNYFTPQWLEGSVGFNVGDPDNYPCGCVATAISQLLYYHRYPVQAPQQGRYGITVTPDDGSPSQGIYVNLLGGDLHGSPYRWDLMPVTAADDATGEERQAIGMLCADAGAAVFTNYGPTGSGASIFDIAPALQQTFHYSSAILGVESEDGLAYTLMPYLESMVNPNLDAGYPVVLCIYSLDGGHAVLMDGYGYNYATPYYHLNMGWSGIDDAWYNLPNVKQFDFVGACVYNIFPEQQGEILSGRVADQSDNPVSEVTVTLTQGTDSRSTVTDANGIYAFAGLEPETTFQVSVSKPECTFIPPEREATTGRSVDALPVCGNVWAVDFELECDGDGAGPSNATDGNLEDFSGGSVSAHLPWNVSRWSITDTTWTSPDYSIQSEPILDGQSASLSIALDCQAGPVAFARKVSSEEGFDVLEFYVDGVLQNRWSGEQDWQYVSFPVDSGRHTFEWTYAKDFMMSDGHDRAWLDDISLPITMP